MISWPAVLLIVFVTVVFTVIIVTQWLQQSGWIKEKEDRPVRRTERK